MARAWVVNKIGSNLSKKGFSRVGFKCVSRGRFVNIAILERATCSKATRACPKCFRGTCTLPTFKTGRCPQERQGGARQSITRCVQHKTTERAASQQFSYSKGKPHRTGPCPMTRHLQHILTKCIAPPIPSNDGRRLPRESGILLVCPARVAQTPCPRRGERGQSDSLLLVREEAPERYTSSPREHVRPSITRRAQCKRKSAVFHRSSCSEGMRASARERLLASEASHASLATTHTKRKCAARHRQPMARISGSGSKASPPK